MGSSKSEMLLELKSSMRSGDILKAKAVLKLFTIEDRLLMRRTAFEISRADELMAVNLILFLFSLYPDLREEVPTIADVLITKLQDAPKQIAHHFGSFTPQEQQMLCKLVIKQDATFLAGWTEAIRQSEQEQARLQFVELVATLREIDAAKVLIQFWDDPVEAVRDSVQHFFAGVKYAQSLGELMQWLSKLGGPMPHRSFWDVAVNHLPLEERNQLIASPFAQLRTLAKTSLRNAGEVAIPYLKSNLEHSDNIDVHIHSLNVMGEMGLAGSVEPIREFLYNEPSNANVRFAAYEALGMLPIEKKAHALIMGFSDDDLQVRIAAARAIDRAMDDTLLNGVKRMVAAHDRESLILCECILEAESAKLFLALKDDPFFRRYALTYLTNKAHPDLKAFYLEHADQAKDSDFVAALKPPQIVAPETKKTIFVVDDSRMILVVYRGMLHKLDYDVVLFENPQEALDKLQETKPDFMFTDLNMPQLTGIELARATRAKYDKSQLPIVMVTTQNEDQDDQDALNAGITQILRKPFTQNDLKTVLEAYL